MTLETRDSFDACHFIIYVNNTNYGIRVVRGNRFILHNGKEQRRIKLQNGYIESEDYSYRHNEELYKKIKSGHEKYVKNMLTVEMEKAISND